MRWIILYWTLSLMGGIACISAASEPTVGQEKQAENRSQVETSTDRLPEYVPRFGRNRPLAAVVAENYYTELTDFTWSTAK